MLAYGTHIICVKYMCFYLLSRRYNKPPQRPEPPSVQSSSTTEVQIRDPNYTDAEKHDLLWTLGRLHRANDVQQMIPAWSGYNSTISDANLPITNIRYMPFLRASPTDLSTIYTILTKLVEMSTTIGQSHILVTADMAIYSKAQQILWEKPAELDEKITMRVGGMHTTMALLASIGKLYGDGGLLSLWVESNTYAEATAKQMLQGSQVARGVRGIKIVYEGLFRVFYESFKVWLEKSNRGPMDDRCQQSFQDLQHAFTIKNSETARNAAHDLIEDNHSEIIDAITEFTAEFTAEGRAQSTTFAFCTDAD